MQETQSAADLQSAFAQPGCCICRLLARVEHRYFTALLYEQVNDPGIRDVLRASRGFCPNHVESLAATQNAPFGSAIISQDLLDTILSRLPERVEAEPGGTLAALRSVLGNGSDRHALVRALGATAACPACERFNGLARVYAGTLAASLEREDVSAAYERSAGLCLPHLLLALRTRTSETAVDRLLARQVAAWRELEHELAEFIRKHDYRFQSEGLDARERDVWRRALYALAGQRRGRDEYGVRV